MKDRKKIAIIHHCGVIGGAGKSLLQTVNMLSDDYDITVYCPAGSRMKTFLETNGVAVVPYKFNLGSIPYYSGGPKIISRTFAKELLYILTNKKKRTELLRQCRADIIMVNSVTECFMAKEIKKNTDAAAVCFVRETLPKGNKGLFFRQFKSVMQKFCDTVFFISDFDRLSYNLKIRNAVTVKNSVPDSYFDEYEDKKNEYLAMLGVERSAEEDEYHILYLGGNSELKGYSVICKAMQYLPSYVRLLYAGSNTHLRDKQLAPIASRVDQIGMLEDVSNAFKAADLVVFPATAAHQGRPIFEAGAFGKTVVASDFKEIKEDLQDGVNGAVFKPSDAEELALKISELIEGHYLGKTTAELAEENNRQSRINHSISAVKKVLIGSVNRTLYDADIKNLHIMAYEDGTVADEYIKFINSNFDRSEHFFIVKANSADPQYTVCNCENILWLRAADANESGILLAYASAAKRVFLHADSENYNVLSRILNTQKGKTEKKTSYVAPLTDLVSPAALDAQKPELTAANPVPNILIGGISAHGSRYTEIIDAVEFLKNQNVMLYFTLFSDNSEQNDRIKKYVMSVFSDSKVSFITEKMPLADYAHFLWTVDFGIFEDCSAENTADICRLLYMGKKVFLLKDFSARFKAASDANKISESPVSSELSDIASGRFNYEKSLKFWNKIFSETV